MGSVVPGHGGGAESAQAMASKIVVFPAPLGPMMPVTPSAKVISESRCCLKFLSSRLISRILSWGASAAPRVGNEPSLVGLHLSGQVVSA